MYGSALNLLPQMQHNEEFESIYKEEEEERSQRWERFLENFIEAAAANCRQAETQKLAFEDEQYARQDSNNRTDPSNASENSTGLLELPLWKDPQPTIFMFQQSFSQFVRRNKSAPADSQICGQLPFREAVCIIKLTSADGIAPLEANHAAAEDDLEEEFFDADRSDAMSEASIENGASTGADNTSNESLHVVAQVEEGVYPWTEELQLLVHGGIPMAIRGEVWQVLTGTRTHRVESHYKMLVTLSAESERSRTGLLTRWVNHIDKDLYKIKSDHPASKLDEERLCALRRLLYAYVEYNPDVRYCQAISKIAAMLLFLMPEENAFWTLSGILDDFVQGYYSEIMREAEVDQLVFEDLMREHFPKLTTHLGTLGVKLARITRNWFLHILIGVLPWESVLRVWDVLLFEGTRCMLFRTGLALFEMHAPAIISSHDAEDVIQIVQSRASMTFDSSQLVFTACMGFSAIDEPKLHELRMKHRPSILSNPLESSLGGRFWKSLRGVISKKVSSRFGDDQLAVDDSRAKEINLICSEEQCHDLQDSSQFATPNEYPQLNSVSDPHTGADLQQQVENLKLEVSALKHKLAQKEEQEQAMAQVIVRMEHENKITEDARRFAEQDSSKFQKMYKETLDVLARMEKQAKITESHLLSMSEADAHDNPSNAGGNGQNELAEVSPKSAWSQSFSFPNLIWKPNGSASQSNGYTSHPGNLQVNEPKNGIRHEFKGQCDETTIQKQGVLSGASSTNWRLRSKSAAKDGCS
ncbi:hypothetical protein O6H91_05G101000 [Diphasiastrum complanatum]|uniref:Uncharacterized protein n=1 Tax=Diphasiastrum complanatum TaxID=34168 RepID=A0ACC2DRG4_DIPCM|nr:hypothetical protein O6H91_05G101000 [Diphasiastrum complanatum]